MTKLKPFSNKFDVFFFFYVLYLRKNNHRLGESSASQQRATVPKGFDASLIELYRALEEATWEQGKLARLGVSLEG